MTSQYSDTARRSQVTHVANYRQVFSAVSFSGNKVHLRLKVKTSKLVVVKKRSRRDERGITGDLDMFGMMDLKQEYGVSHKYMCVPRLWIILVATTIAWSSIMFHQV